jgi:hypothetical protein
MVRGISLFYKGKSSFFRRVTLITSILSLVFISLFWLVILVAEDQMEVISLDHWLDAEARMFERDYQLQGAAADLPNHYEFDSYWSEEPMPLWLKEYTTPGYYEHHLGPEDKHFLVRQHPSGKGLFYVVFKDNADDYLDEYESKLHLFTLLFGFAIMLLTVCYGVYMVRQMAVPLRNVVSKIKQMSPEQPSFVVEARFEELRTIEQALFDSKKHIAAFFQREQEFSRFAAHEIRTPLMVLQGSSELLQTMLAEEPRFQKALLRIERACQDIALLTDTFLLLGKETIDAHHYQQLDLETVLREQLPLAQSAAISDTASWTIQVHQNIQLWAPQSFVRVVLINLLKNAFIHGNGELLVELNESQLKVSNSSSKEQDSQGYGYGLVIVERICSRMGWQLDIQHQSVDFCVQISFSPEPKDTV